MWTKKIENKLKKQKEGETLGIGKWHKVKAMKLHVAISVGDHWENGGNLR